MAHYCFRVLNRPIIQQFTAFFCLVVFPFLGAHGEVFPEPPSELAAGTGYDISPAIVRASARYLDQLIATEGRDMVLVFPGRSMTVMSILAEQRGLSVLNIPGSGLTESLVPAKWKDPVLGPKLELYRGLVREDVLTSFRSHPGKKMVLVDMADTGESILRFQSLLRSILKEGGESSKVQSYYLRDFGMRPEVAVQMESEDVKELKLDIPMDTSGKKLTEGQTQAWMDRYYRHQVEAIEFAGRAGNVPKFDVLEVEPGDPDSVSAYRERYANRKNPLNELLRAYTASVLQVIQTDPAAIRCERLFTELK